MQCVPIHWAFQESKTLTRRNGSEFVIVAEKQEHWEVVDQEKQTIYIPLKPPPSLSLLKSWLMCMTGSMSKPWPMWAKPPSKAI